MKTYWDSSALVQSVYDPEIKARFEREGGLTRTHSLAEVFSALTANPVTRLDADSASRIVGILAEQLDFVDLSAREIVAGLRQARRLGVRGGRVHDLLHALAAEKGQAANILTLDRLIAFGELLNITTSSPTFPDKAIADGVKATLRMLRDDLSMWHGNDLTDAQAEELLQKCFPE